MPSRLLLPVEVLHRRAALLFRIPKALPLLRDFARRDSGDGMYMPNCAIGGGQLDLQPKQCLGFYQAGCSRSDAAARASARQTCSLAAGILCKPWPPGM